LINLLRKIFLSVEPNIIVNLSPCTCTVHRLAPAQYTGLPLHSAPACTYTVHKPAQCTGLHSAQACTCTVHRAALQ